MAVVIDPHAFYRPDEAADLLGVTVDTLRQKRQRDSSLPFCRYGRRVFYRGADIIAALEAGRRTSTSDAPLPMRPLLRHEGAPAPAG